ncbi:uncharacterized protein L201_002104 [Kwoniella dendrophila CBS 6074]|uniref:Uncharacterized protein n=1 Tax=Kwoniella dendrophila CBS 6074 TaxID=1295534 RepID=A0AAX4JP99_9TREE
MTAFIPNNVEKMLSAMADVISMGNMTLFEIQASGEASDRGDLRHHLLSCFIDDEDEDQELLDITSSWYNGLSEEHREWVLQLRSLRPPLISISGDMSEDHQIQNIDDCDEFDSLPLSADDGPIILHVEVRWNDMFGGEFTTTYLHEKNMETPILAACLDKAEAYAVRVLKVGITSANLNSNQLENECRGIISGKFSVTDVTVQEFELYSTFRQLVQQAATGAFAGAAQENQVLTIRVMLTVQLSSGTTFHVGFEQGVVVGRDRGVRLATGQALHYSIVPKYRRWQESPFWVLSSYAAYKVQPDGQRKTLSAINPFYTGGDFVLPQRNNRHYNDTVDILDAAIRKFEDLTGFKPIDISLMLFGCYADGGRTPTSFHYFTFIGMALLGQALPQRRNLKPNKMRAWMLKHSRRYSATAAQFARRKTVCDQFIARDQEWMEEHDGPALTRATDLLARFNEPKETALVAFFDIDENQTAPIRTSVTWAADDDRAIGRRILNEAAQSNVAPFDVMQIQEDDWKSWYTFLAAGTEESGERYDAVTHIGQKIVDAFPRARFHGKQLRELAKQLPDVLWSHQVRIEGNTYTVNDKYYTDKEFLKAAICLYICGEQPYDPENNEGGYPAGVYYVMKQALPHRTVKGLKSMVTETQYDKVKLCYDILLEEIEDQGLALFGGNGGLPENIERLMRDMGLGPVERPDEE